MQSFKELRNHWYSDLYRYEESQVVNIKKLILRQYISPGYRYTFWLRLCKYLRNKNRLYTPIYIVAMVILQRYKYKYGIEISPKTKIGKGFYIGHFGGIVINSQTEIGANCNISQGVTIGMSNRGDKKGVAVVGNNVYIGPGAKIVGAVYIGDNAAIGANCVVTKDVPANAVVVGVPGKVISMNGSNGYIGNTHYNF
ncbi:serine O-acetyltransferase [Bacillus nitratireducens]|uniref:serine O-acetyltransferase n=1 Tax=Bacillus nitratireducens TaxID=2026193 RepID=UPI001F55F8BA|nr:serine O-acetyltransferase [Bacillus nitratireducens]UNP74889.1 serine O-acetyltransferase [Bacillus nitratireducens]